MRLCWHLGLLFGEEISRINCLTIGKKKMNQRKQRKAKERRKACAKKRNLDINTRRRGRSWGTQIKIKRHDKAFCEECFYIKKNKKSQINCYYCGLYDRNAYNEDDLFSWGKFKGNKAGDCRFFKRVNFFVRIIRRIKNREIKKK